MKGANVEFSVSGKADGYVAVGFNKKAKMVGTIVYCVEEIATLLL